jgi:hypothetical protein
MNKPRYVADDVVVWRRSSFCANSGCVEFAERGDRILLRGTDNITLELMIPRQMFERFLLETMDRPLAERSVFGEVEVERTDTEVIVKYRDQSIVLSPGEWHTFIRGVTSGEFSDLALSANG